MAGTSDLRLRTINADNLGPGPPPHEHTHLRSDATANLENRPTTVKIEARMMIGLEEQRLINQALLLLGRK